MKKAEKHQGPRLGTLASAQLRPRWEPISGASETSLKETKYVCNKEEGQSVNILNIVIEETDGRNLCLALFFSGIKASGRAEFA